MNEFCLLKYKHTHTHDKTAQNNETSKKSSRLKKEQLTLYYFKFINISF